jgi:hypothetical protein
MIVFRRKGERCCRKRDEGDEGDERDERDEGEYGNTGIRRRDGVME